MPSPMQCSRRVALSVLIAVGLTVHGGHATSAEHSSEPQQEYEAQVKQQDWEAAIAAAQKLVAAARQDPQQPLALATALSQLGDAHFGKADYGPAGAAYEEALRIVEQREGMASPALIDPLEGIGKTLSMTGRHQEAVPHLERALVLTRRSYGLFDARQRDLLRYLVTSLTALRNPEAERHVVYLLQMAERSYGRRDQRMVPWLCVVGNWYAYEAGEYSQARAHYRRALDIVERKLGPNDPAAVTPLREIARSYTHELQRSIAGKTSRERTPTDADGNNERRPLNPRYLNNEGENSLERALHILDAQPDPDPNMVVLTLIDLGDWHQIKHQPDKALPLYRRAAQLFELNPSAATRTNVPKGAASSMPAALSFPVRVYYPVPLLATRNVTLPPEEVNETFVEVEFTVTGSGDVVDARVTDRNGTERQASEALQAIRGARFRPKFVNGQPVETRGMTNREIFRTRKLDETKQYETSRRDS